MPQFLQIDGLRISEGSLRVAVDRYEEFKASEDYNEAYKWEILDEAHTWLEENELRTDTVGEFVDLIQDLQPQSGPLVDWSQVQRLRDFVEEDRTRAAAAIQDLLYGEGELHERITYFREMVALGTDCLAFMFAARDPEQFAPYKDRMFRDFLDIFHEGEVPSLGSVADKLTLYSRLLDQMADFLNEENILEDADALDVQDLMWSLTQKPDPRADVELELLHWLAVQLNGYQDDPDRLLDVISDLPDDFLEEEADLYQGKAKIRRVRYQVVQAALRGEEIDLEAVKQQEAAKYEKDILQSWTDFTILAQIYYDLFKHRVERIINDLASEVSDRLSLRNTKTHVVTFQGSQNFVTTGCWFALYPVEAETHRKAYQLFCRINAEGAIVGLYAGDEMQDIPEGDRRLDQRTLAPTELKFDTVISHFVELRPRYQQLTKEDEAEEDEVPDHRPVFDEIEDHLTVKGQVILYGPPGTGKTYMAQQFARWWLHDQTQTPVQDRQLRTVTFHPSFSYEDFLEGLTAKPTEDGLSYEIQDGLLKRAAKDAQRAYEKAGEDEEPAPYLLIIDEINRGNLPRILGETVTLLEFDKRLGRDNETSVQLAHSGDAFTLPPNLYIIGTMNTADRSIALIDAAIQRRFRSIHFPPDYDVLFDELGFEGRPDAQEAASSDADQLRALQALSILALEHINERIRNSGSLGKGKQIGHAYLLGGTEVGDLVGKWSNDILPLLEDYYFGQTARIRDEIFDGGGERLFDWELEQLRDFDAEDLIETFRDLLGAHPDTETPEE